MRSLLFELAIVLLFNLSKSENRNNQCVLPTENQLSFFWKDRLPYFYDADMNECPLILDETSDLNLNLLSFGDSYEWGMCGATRRDTDPNWYVKSLGDRVEVCR